MILGASPKMLIRTPRLLRRGYSQRRTRERYSDQQVPNPTVSRCSSAGTNTRAMPSRKATVTGESGTVPTQIVMPGNAPVMLGSRSWPPELLEVYLLV